jgi:hypothetical protein
MAEAPAASAPEPANGIRPAAACAGLAAANRHSAGFCVAGTGTDSRGAAAGVGDCGAAVGTGFRELDPLDSARGAAAATGLTRSLARGVWSDVSEVSDGEPRRS